ncbi:hypothetical protein BAE44_0024762 [Dichanthelium oligosanthes]|uniref:Uncharacterized protein n=1 Tax=Dichanthelium oligosanthes TaxID=888268 RepID=A0A1E5UN24_9POAL|nr:hypothetical protein BAE44_0024762 [Dichanthelium oligosanthes]
MAEEKGALQSAREWVVEHKLRAVGTHVSKSLFSSPLLLSPLKRARVFLITSVPFPFSLCLSSAPPRSRCQIASFLDFLFAGTLWLSGIVGSIAYNWSRPGMKTSVKIIHARFLATTTYTAYYCLHFL